MLNDMNADLSFPFLFYNSLYNTFEQRPLEQLPQLQGKKPQQESPDDFFNDAFNMSLLQMPKEEFDALFNSSLDPALFENEPCA
jgi:hypothetical protein